MKKIKSVKFKNICKSVFKKIFKFINVCITNFFIICGIILILMLLYPDNIKPDDINIITIFNIFMVCSSMYMVVFLCKEMLHSNEYIERTLPIEQISEKKDILDPKLKEYAYLHEAGHAVIANLLGIEVMSVEIDKTITKSINVMAADEAYLKKLITILYGGPATEKLMLGRISNGCLGSDGADFNFAEKHIKDMVLMSDDYPGYVACGKQFDDKVNEISTKLFNKAEKMVDENREIIKEVADQLMMKDKLSGNEVKHIVEKSKKNCVFYA